MAVYVRPSGPGVAERVRCEPGSDAERAYKALAEAGTDGWHVEDEASKEPVRDELIGDAEPDEVTVPRPSTADSKAKWSYYVQVEYGVDPDDADAMTKADLMAYGQ